MLSDNIKNLRKQKGYTQETLAQALNIVRQTVSKWEKGYSVPDADMLEKLAEVLEVPVSDLLGQPQDAQIQPSDIEKISSQLAILNDQMARDAARRKRNFKIAISIVAAVLVLLTAGIVLFFTALGVELGIGPGLVDNVQTRYVESSIFTQEEIQDGLIRSRWTSAKTGMAVN